MQITTVIFFDFQGMSNKFWGFKQVPLANLKLGKVPGLSFFKSMGSGGGEGFDAWPSFSKYSWIMVWDERSKAEDFLKNNPYFKEAKSRASGINTLYLKNIMSHGKWSGKSPFIPDNSGADDSKIVVLTRARIRLSRLWQFWRKVGKTAKDLYRFDELEFAVGIGELPLIQQATISIWSSIDAVKRYAYKQEAHKKVIALTRKYNWYSEELFARFFLEKEVKLK